MHLLILQVQDLAASERFYGACLGRPPRERGPVLLRFKLNGQTELGLRPSPAGRAAGAEIALALEDEAAVQAFHASWLDEGLPVLHPPRHEALGFSACTVDPDGHQVRVFVPA